MKTTHRLIGRLRGLLAAAEVAAPQLGGYNRSYVVEGSRLGSVYLFDSGRYVWEYGRERVSGDWHVNDGSLLVFDHYLHTDDAGRTFYSHHMKLSLADDRAGGSWGNSDRVYAAFARRAYAVPKLRSREIDLFDVLPRGGVIAELGVEWGAFASVILDKARPARLHLVDCWDALPNPWTGAAQERRKYNSVLKRFATEMRRGQVIVHRGDDRDVLASFPDASFDWIYIDTTHQYEHTLRELHAAAPKVKPDGFLCGHDYVDNRVSRRHGFGVIAAVDEFVEQSEWEYAYLTGDEYASFVLRTRARAAR